MSRIAVQRILAEADLQPHKSRYWLHSDDPDFEAKALDVCRLYLDAPRLYQHGELVLCVDEKTGIQALERRGRPRPGRRAGRSGATRSTSGTATALPAGDAGGADGAGDRRRDAAAGDLGLRATRAGRRGAVPGRHALPLGNGQPEYALHLRAVPVPGEAVRGVGDEAAVDDRGQRRAFLTDPSHKHVVHYTPKHGSWLNQVEIWFGVLCRRLLRRGEFRSVGELAERILGFIDYYDRHDAHPYEWTYTGKPLVSGDARRKRKRVRHRRKMLVNMRAR